MMAEKKGCQWPWMATGPFQYPFNLRTGMPEPVILVAIQFVCNLWYNAENRNMF